MHDRRRNRISNPFVFLFSLLLLVSAGQPALAATKAGRVVFATGQPVAVNAGGASRSLARGDDVFAGDTLKTDTRGRLQVSFIDGAYVSVQPDSEYKIEEYRFSGKQDGTESAVSRLIKGGVRAVTGLIGKEHHDAYKVHTSAATIGIRGTGFNTRICQGDCPGKADGLYHNTWEGITYVFNNVDSVEIPSGKGVYVRDMNTPIRFLSQPPSVTALRTGEKREQEQKDEEDQSRTIAAGDQRNNDGLQTVVVGDSTIIPTSSRTLLKQNFIAVMPGNSDQPQAPPVDTVSGTDTTVFTTDAGFIGILTTEHDSDQGNLRSVGTIDLAAVLGGDDPDSVREVNKLLAGADQTQVEAFQADPASPVESTINPVGIGWGRWADGRVLIMVQNGHTELQELSGNQSIHFVFGPEPPVIPTTGSAVYGFLGGTQSTSASGASIGDGVIGGVIQVFFSDYSAFLGMGVNHDGNMYDVFGPLNVDTADNHITDIPGEVTAVNYTELAGPDSPCMSYPGCGTDIEGGFAGPMDDQGNPANLGIEYTIQTQDPITGVAAFSTSVVPQDVGGGDIPLPPIGVGGPALVGPGL